MDLPTQALALGYLSLSWGFGTILGDLSEESSVMSCCAPCSMSIMGTCTIA